MMEQKELKITCPEGYEIDKENSTFECIKFIPINKLPSSWEEFCDNHPVMNTECYIDSCGIVHDVTVNGIPRRIKGDNSLLPSRALAEAMVALCQLIQLRDCYNDGWLPIWNNATFKYCIASQDNTLTVLYNTVTSHVLAFKSKELANQFIKNFYELLRIAEPLL